MTFEEKLAAYGRKMDELKAQLDEAVGARKAERQQTRDELTAEIARLDAAFDEFDAAIDAKIDRQLDAADARREEFAEKLDARLDEVDAKVDAKINQVDAKIDAGLDAMDARIEQKVAQTKTAFTLDKATAEAVANEPTRIDDIERATAEQVARAKGDIAMVEENARLAHEYRDSKRDAIKLRTQMKVNNAKDKIADRREAVDKAAQEEWVIDLLDYAESCYEMAYAWALEGEYTLMEAAYEINDYNERFGGKE